MPRTITITAGGASLEAELNDSPSAEAIWEHLPLEAPADTWGQEIYFGIGLSSASAPDGRTDMAVGELAYWPPGQAFCIFFGPTPASDPNDPAAPPRAASPVNPVGMILGDPAPLRDVADGQIVTLAKAE